MRPPPLHLFYQLNRNLRSILSLTYELDLSAAHHFPLYPAPRNTFPGSFPVILPPSITGTPLTST